MRTLLRNRVTGLYFKVQTSGPATQRQALDFKMIDRAIEFIETWRLRDMELAFAFRDYRQVTGVPVEKMALKYSES